MKSNPLRILEALDRHLSAEVTLYVYGRSALALGFPNAPAEYHATMDVDAILPHQELQAIEANEDFWRAQERVNQELGEAGLYFTHLFEDRQVILTSDWRMKSLAISGFEFRRLQLRRPATPDLILTKMMRVDPQDRDDIIFLLGQRDAPPLAVQSALAQAVVPPIPEIEEAFSANRSWLARRLTGVDELPHSSG